MADFKTALHALARGDVEFDAVAANLTTMLKGQAQIAEPVMEQLREAYGEDLIDAAIYARLKKVVAAHGADAAGSQEVDEATQFDSDKTTVASTADETEFLEDEDDHSIAAHARAALNATSETESSLDFDLTADSLPSDGSWPSTDTGATGTGWAETPDEGRGEAKIEPGSVLKDRFKLDDVLGVGGMGTVYRGRDLIKVEARDRNPYVALKVLNEDFKQHPDSFIALQREASRQQKLAHPNIATVYDFDRTRGGTVFLTMELLEGEPLNTFIKKKVRPKGGLPFEEAFPMIDGLGKALIYAHEHSIVHSDFKPGNCFQTKEGVMKVLDFGIARAVKNPGQGEGEKTLFDPGKLGALTPAYASAEMLEGEEPDPRDDLYALACVAYELLTGKHPFNKLPANSARDNNLVPRPVKALKRKQLKGLMRGLAFARADRSQTVGQFLEELEGHTSPFKNPFIMAPAAIVVIGLAGVAPALNYIHEREIEQQIEAVKSGDLQQIERVLESLDTPDVDGSDRDRILVATRTEVLEYFQDQINQRVDVGAGRFNFVGANAVIERVAAMNVFRDSAQVQDWRETIENAESVLLNEQTVVFNEALAANRLLPMEGGDDVHDALDVISKFAPAAVESLMQRLPGHYATAIDRTIVNEEFELAKNLSTAGLGIIPDNKNLINLVAKIDGAQERVETARDILTYTARINEAMASGDRVAAFLPIQEDIKNLSRIDPGNELLKQLARKVGPLVDKEIGALTRSKKWGTSDLVQNDYGDLLRSLGMRDKDVRAAKLRDEFDAEVAKRVSSVSTAVAADRLAPPASPNATTLVSNLQAMAPDHARTLEAREIAARGYLVKARAARAKQNFADAESALAAATEIAGEAPVVESLGFEAKIIAGDKAADAAGLEQRIANRRAEFEQGLQNAQQAFGSLEPDAETISLSLSRYDALASLSPADDRLPDLREQLTASVAKVGDRFGEKEQWGEAVKATRDALTYAPGSDLLSGKLSVFETRQREAIVEKQHRYVADRKQEVETLLADATATRQWSEKIQRNMADIQILGDADDPWTAEFKSRIGEIYVAKATSAREDERFAEGANLLERAERYAPELETLGAERQALAAATEAFEREQREQREQERLARIEGLKQDFATQANANDVSSATKTLDQLRVELGESDAFVTKSGPQMLADAYYKLATRKAEQKDFAAALKLAKGGLKLQPGRQELRLAVKGYTVDGNRQDLARTFGRDGEFDLAEVLEKASEVQTLDPRAYSEAESGWAQAVANRLQALQESTGEQSNALLDRAKEVFAGNQLIAGIDRAGPVIGESPPPPSKSPCSSKLAGHGKRKKGTCFDMVSQSTRGPLMVVVPGGADFAQPFAIGKYEVTVGDFNNYCKSSGACESTDRDKRLPITGVSFEEATAYAKWLSDRTGNTYRLPTVDEWSYAADAGGQQPRKDYNCRVEQGGQILKGQSTMGVNTGKANGWGLYNYVGNAQEWARSGEGVVVRGGAFEDTFSKCSISLEKPHSGGADKATGFRLLQELG